MLKLIPGSPVEPYNELIELFIGSEFPVESTGEMTMEVVVKELFGSKQQRPVPLPSIEHQAKVRAIVLHCIDQGLPIPILVPWGSKKPDNGGIDVAELSAIRMMECLYWRVRRLYEPGVVFRMRLEDVTGYFLFKDEPGHREAADLYVGGVRKLVDVLGLCGIIQCARESDYLDEIAFNERAEATVPVMAAYLKQVTADPTTEGKGAFEAPAALGWKGVLPKVQRDFYLTRYREFYPGMSQEYLIDKLSRYFTESLVRNQLVGTGSLPSWGDKYIQMNFSVDPPGMPVGRAHNRIYYRTARVSDSRTHIAPWRARGVLQVRGREIVPKIRYYTDDIVAEPLTYKLTRNGMEVELRTPLVIES